MTAPCVDDFSRALGDNTNTGAAAGEGNEIVGRSSDAAAGWKRLEGGRKGGGRDGEIAALPPSCLLLDVCFNARKMKIISS